MTIDWHRRAARAAERATAGQAASALRRLLDGLARRRHRRDAARLTAHLAWTARQREAFAPRRKRRS